MKRWVALLSLLFLVVSASAAVAAERNITVLLNGQTIKFEDQAPFIDGGRTLVPIRAVFAGVGAEIGYDGATQTATVKVGDTTIVIQANNQTAHVNGEPRELDVPAQLVSDRIVVPLRFMVEALDGEVHWEDATSTINLGTTDAGKAAIRARKAQDSQQGTLAATASLRGPVNATWTIEGQRLDAGNQLYEVVTKIGSSITMDSIVAVRDGVVRVRDGFHKWSRLGSMEAALATAGVPVNPTDMMSMVMRIADGYALEGAGTLQPTFSLEKARALHDDLLKNWPLTGKSELKAVSGKVLLGEAGEPAGVELTIVGAFTYVENNQTKTEEWTLSVTSAWTAGAPQIEWPDDMPE